MAFVLPGNSRQLRFTGEVKAQAPAKREAAARNGALALGKPRVRKPPPPPPAARVQTPIPAAPTRVSAPAPGGRPRTLAPARTRHRNEPIPSPYLGSVNPPVLGYPPPEGDFDDDQPTMAMDRDGRDVLPGARALRTPKPVPAAGAPPIPHFRPANHVAAQPKMVIVPGTASTKTETKTAGAPLLVWLVASLLVGIISYHVAPEIVMRPDLPAAAAHQR